MMNCADCPYQSELYKDLTESQLEMINRHRYEMVYEPGEIIIKQGTNCTHVLSFISGMAKIYVETVVNGDLLVRLIKPHEFITGSGLFSGEPHRFTIAAVEESKVCLIDAQIIREIIQENSNFSVKMLSHLQENMSFTLDRLVSFYVKHHSGRIAETLLYLTDTIYKKDSIELTLSKKDIAGLAGVSRENAQRLLKTLEKDNIIRMNGKTLEILDKEKLKQIAANG